MKKVIALLIAGLLFIGIFSQCTTTGPTLQSIIASPQEGDTPAGTLGNNGQEHIDNTGILKPGL